MQSAHLFKLCICHQQLLVLLVNLALTIACGNVPLVVACPQLFVCQPSQRLLRLLLSLSPRRVLLGLARGCLRSFLILFLLNHLFRLVDKGVLDSLAFFGVCHDANKTSVNRH